jgi:hypothetical protein
VNSSTENLDGPTFVSRTSLKKEKRSRSNLPSRPLPDYFTQRYGSLQSRNNGKVNAFSRAENYSTLSLPGLGSHYQKILENDNHKFQIEKIRKNERDVIA